MLKCAVGVMITAGRSITIVSLTASPASVGDSTVNDVASFARMSHSVALAAVPVTMRRNESRHALVTSPLVHVICTPPPSARTETAETVSVPSPASAKLPMIAGGSESGPLPSASAIMPPKSSEYDPAAT